MQNIYRDAKPGLMAEIITASGDTVRVAMVKKGTIDGRVRFGLRLLVQVEEQDVVTFIRDPSAEPAVEPAPEVVPVPAPVPLDPKAPIWGRIGGEKRP